MTTQSEQYDNKLRSQLYAIMLELQELNGDLHEAEERNDEDGVELTILKLLDVVPIVIGTYFAVVEKGQEHV